MEHQKPQEALQPDARKSGADGDAPLMEAMQSTRVSAIVNLSLSIVQILAGVLSTSQALVADGLHTLSDLVADFVVLLASRHSRRGADAQHPYGHHRLETVATLLLGVILIGVGIGMVAAALGRLDHYRAAPSVHPMALGIAVIALISKETLFRYLLAVAERVKSSLLVANAWHARSDAASSLVVAIAIAGNLAGYPMLDAIAALVVGLMVSRMGGSFAWNALHDLMDRAADQIEIDEIRQTLLETPGVAGVHELRTRKMGDLIHADAHLEVDADLTVEQGHRIATDARARVLKRHRVLNLMTHVDPVRRTASVPAAAGPAAWQFE